MKNLLYIIAGLIITIWIIVFRPNEIIHLLLALAALIMLITIFFNKKLSKNNKENTK
jgi:ABC-type polysaccharide/polyol phosphate export permease